MLRHCFGCLRFFQFGSRSLTTSSARTSNVGVFLEFPSAPDLSLSLHSLALDLASA